MKKRILSIILIVLIIIVFFNGYRYYWYIQLDEPMRARDIDSVQEILSEKPSAIRTSIINYNPPILLYALMDIDAPHLLTYACKLDDMDMVMYFVENGAEVNIGYWSCPLSITYDRKNENWYEISGYLIDHGAAVDYSLLGRLIPPLYSQKGTTCLCDIVERSSVEPPDDEEHVYQAFCYALDHINEKSVNWEHVMLWTVMFDRPDIVRLILVRGYIGVNDSLQDSFTPLTAAARDSCTDSAALLLELGADPNLRDPDGKTAMDYAEENGDADMIALLQSS